MNRRAIRAIAMKDLRVVANNKGVTIPLIIAPLILMVGLPALVGLAPSLAASMPGTPLNGLDTFIESMPDSLLQTVAGYDEMQTMIVLALVYLFAPLFLVLPMMVASVIAADSFAGEKERKTLEALLYTPTSDGDLFVGKLLAAWLPALAVALLGFVAYGLVANLAAWPIMGEIFFPNLMWLVLVFWVAPAVAGLGLSTMVLVSVRAQGFQDAYQIGGAVVIPIVLLLVAQATGVMYFSVGLVLLLGFVFWLIDAVLLWLGVRTFRRSQLASRL
ncbi:MAG: ABC transporter permease subunit [Candidatus Promineifilaceae bacterium]|nr:ABC transporter permease subunit [Candidatus Promineifilaceae bacterium]